MKIFFFLLSLFVFLLFPIATFGAPKAYAKTPHPVIVAIIDTGIDASHPKLQQHLWVNPGETGKDAQGRDKASNGLDDDRNGFIDDVNGWNFARDNAELIDRHGHGTHIAGIILNNNPSSQIKIMVLKYYDTQFSSRNSVQATIQAMKYAVAMGAQIINFSAGGPEPHPTEREVLELAKQRHILLVAAAGNEGQSLQNHPYFPASYPLSNILSVTAVNPSNQILPTSNYGKSVGIATLGENVVSTLPGRKMGELTGTSQATAFVTRAAADLKLAKPELQPTQIIQRLVLGGNTIPTLKQKTKAGTALNADRSLAMSGRDEGLVGTTESNVNPTTDVLFLSDFDGR